MQLDVTFGAVDARFVRGVQRQAGAIQFRQSKVWSVGLTARHDLIERAIHLAARTQVTCESFNRAEICLERVLTANRTIARRVRLPRSERAGRFDLSVRQRID